MKLLVHSSDGSVFAAKTSSNKPMIPASKVVQMLGNYLYKHVEQAKKKVLSGSDNYTIWCEQLLDRSKMTDERFQITSSAESGLGDMFDGLEEMVDNSRSWQPIWIMLNLVTYQNKIRVNLIEYYNGFEKTIGHTVIPPDVAQDVKKCSIDLVAWVNKRFNKFYGGKISPMSLLFG